MCKHFSPEEREWVSQMKFAGATLQEIADRLGRSKGTINREIKHNFERGTILRSRRTKKKPKCDVPAARW